MTEHTNKGVRIPKSRILFAYVMCAVGALLGPLDDYQELGNVESSTWIISMMAFCVGIAIVHFVVFRLTKYGKFMHYNLNSRE